MMGLGTLIVLVFSDPMVDVLNELGVRFNIKFLSLSLAFPSLLPSSHRHN
jgi:hypothetical protein